MTYNFNFFASTQPVCWPEPVTRDFEENKFFLADTCKRKLLIFPAPAGMSLAKLSLAGKN
jgi:hypothetical protein